MTVPNEAAREGFSFCFLLGERDGGREKDGEGDGVGGTTEGGCFEFEFELWLRPNGDVGFVGVVAGDEEDLDCRPDARSARGGVFAPLKTS